MTATRAIILTSSMRRHRFVANRLAERLDVVGVWQEQKAFDPLRYAASADDEAVIRRHFEARDASEEQFFAADDDLRGVLTSAVHMVASGGCNDAAEIERMRRAQPDVVCVFGTGLLKRALIDAFPGLILNIHLGLSPYYRGAGTNFWPLVNGEPEYCGATIHFLDAGVDSGPIVAHVRPQMRATDGPHEIGNKVIVAAVDALADAAIAHAAHPISGIAQWGEGRFYRRADFSAAAVRALYANFENGMIPDYLAHQAERDRRVPVVTLTEAR